MSLIIYSKDIHEVHIVHLLGTQATHDYDHALHFMIRWLRGDSTFTFSTSGSTGTPKRIKHSRSKMTVSAQATIDFLRLKPGMTAFLCMDSNFIGGAMMLVRAIVGGMNLIITAPKRNPLQDLGTKFDFAAMVPLQLQEILSYDDQRELDLLNSAHSLLIGGAAPSEALAEQTESIKCAVYATYGMTETVSHIALRRLNGPLNSTHYSLLPGYQIRKGSDSTLEIRGTTTDDKWLKTNDIAEIKHGNQFTILGRVDNVINTGGIKVHAELVETKIRPFIAQNMEITNFFVAGFPDKVYGNIVGLILESAGSINEKMLLARLKELKGLSRYEIPKRIYCESKFPLTDSGKTNRQSILKRLHAL